MDDSVKTMIKLAALGVAGYLVYQWLQKSGYWAQWFGGGNTFSTPQALLTYCHANPGGSAIYAPAGGASTTAPCAQWIAANGGAPPASTGGGTTPPPTTGGGGSLVALPSAATLTSWMQAHTTPSRSVGSVSEWNFATTHLITGFVEPTVDIGFGDTQITADQYIQGVTAWRQTGGGMGWIGASVPRPYGWVM